MKRASGIGHLKPFLPGLETLLEDPEVSEIMINGPGNVWIERGGRLEPHEAPGLAAGDGPRGRPVGPLGPQEHPGLRRHGLGQDDALERADRVAARRRADRRHRGHARTQDRARQLPPLRGRSCRHRDPVSIRDLVRHALRHRPDHIVVGEVRGGETADLLQALNTGHGGSLTTIHANNARSALSRLASCAMQAEGALPWEVTCRGVVDGIALVLHTTRQRGRRFVEEALEVRGYDAAKGRWIAEPIWSGAAEAPQEQHPHTKEVNP